MLDTDSDLAFHGNIVHGGDVRWISVAIAVPFVVALLVVAPTTSRTTVVVSVVVIAVPVVVRRSHDRTRSRCFAARRYVVCKKNHFENTL